MREPIEIAVDGRRYVLRQPSIAELSTFKRAVRRAGGRQVALGDRLLLIEAGLKAIGDDPEVARALGIVSEAKGRLLAFIDEVQSGAFGDDPAEMAGAAEEALAWPAELLHIAEVVERQYQPYADAIADAEVYPEISGRVALELFLEDVEGLSVPMARSMGRVAAATIEAVPASDLPVIHARFRAEIEVREAEKKGSRSPISTGESPSSSEATSTPRPTGHSRPTKPSTSPPSASDRSPSTRSGRPSRATTS